MARSFLHPADPAPSDEVSGLELALRYVRTGYPVRAYQSAAPILEQARKNQDTRQIASATQVLAASCLMTGNFEAGIAYAREARHLFSTLQDFRNAARAGANLAWLLATIGEQESIAEALAALDLAESIGDVTETIWALDTNAIVFWLLRQFDRALPFAERAVELSRLRTPRLQRPLINLAGVRVELALQARAQGMALQRVVEDAVALTLEALAFSRAAGDGWLERLALCNIAEYRLHIGHTEGAAEALQQVPEAAGEMSDRCTYQYLHMLGRVRAAQGRTREAIDILTSGAEIAGRVEDLWTAAPCYEDLSQLHAGLGDFETALACHRTFHALYVRQASEAAQRRARLMSLEWEADRLRASAERAQRHAAELTATNHVLAQETERLLRASMEDPLTGLQNRRRLDLTFLDIMARGQHYAIAMIDIDRFKAVNDRFTHLVGDSVLRLVADHLRDNAREGDVIVRFGGDEFAMLFRDANATQAMAICERLRTGIRGHDWTAIHAGLDVTLSIGVAASHEAATQEAVLALADQRLYRAKRLGRDRIEVA